MDLCVIDLRVIAPIVASLIASGTALYISNKWSGQKGTEVIANEAKNSLIYLSELQRLQMEIINSIKKSEKKVFNQHRLDRFKLVQDLFSNSSVFLGHSINNQELKHYTSSISSQAINFIKEIDEYYFKKDEAVLKSQIDIAEASLVTMKLLDYSLYRNIFKYKKVK